MNFPDEPEIRLEQYEKAAADWADIWPHVLRQVRGLPLPEAHAKVAEAAEGVLPYEA